MTAISSLARSCLMAASVFAVPASLASEIASAPSRGELATLCGRYALSDGRELTIDIERRELWAHLGFQEPVRLQGTGSRNAFRSEDGAWRVEFLSTANGIVTGVRMTLTRPRSATSREDGQAAEAAVAEPMRASTP
jgi:hypothetical protein